MHCSFSSGVSNSASQDNYLLFKPVLLAIVLFIQKFQLSALTLLVTIHPSTKARKVVRTGPGCWEYSWINILKLLSSLCLSTVNICHGLRCCYSRHGLRTSISGITWELAKLSQTCWIRICILTKSLGALFVHWSWRRSGWHRLRDAQLLSWHHITDCSSK